MLLRTAASWYKWCCGVVGSEQGDGWIVTPIRHCKYSVLCMKSKERVKQEQSIMRRVDERREVLRLQGGRRKE